MLPTLKKQYRKKKIPKALRNQVWIVHMGEHFRAKCFTSWCTNIITPFTFEAGHNVPESHGGQTTIHNLVPICSNCNKSMGNSYTFDEWSETYNDASMHNPIYVKESRKSTITTTPITSLLISSSLRIPYSELENNYQTQESQQQDKQQDQQLSQTTQEHTIVVTSSKKGLCRFLSCFSIFKS
jgi:HNH endonuclease